MLALTPIDMAVGEGVYQRGRPGGRHGGWGPPAYNPYFWQPGFFAPPIVTGSWYTRPYPYHFDYYRWRYSMPPQRPCVDQQYYPAPLQE